MSVSSQGFDSLLRVSPQRVKQCASVAHPARARLRTHLVKRRVLVIIISNRWEMEIMPGLEAVEEIAIEIHGRHGLWSGWVLVWI